MAIGDILHSRREIAQRGTNGVAPPLPTHQALSHPEALERYLTYQIQNIGKHLVRLSNQKPSRYGLDHQQLGDVTKQLRAAKEAMLAALEAMTGEQGDDSALT